MTDPTLTRVKVVVGYSASDKYRQELTIRSGVGPKPSSPENALLSGLEELARLTALFGLQDQALEVFTAARKRVAAAIEARRMDGAP